MALKNLFDMVKADRYTQDGREAIIKAQEEETEDKVYQIGEISQKTGLQKTANGWVKPKSGKQPGKTDKQNPNGVVAQQKQKLEAEKYEAARRDAQAPSKKTEVNTPGLRKDVQEAIKRSTPEEIKAYIKELRTPGSRMSRYFDNPDLLANVYEDELNKMTAGKPSRASKEEAIRKDLGLTEGEDMSRFSDEQIEKMYAKTQQTPEQQKADFDKSKIGQAVNKGRQEFAAEKTRQKELASKTNAIGLPKQDKPSADWKETPSGRTNMIRTPEGTATVTWNKEANGEEWYGFSTVKNNKMKSSDTHYKTKAEAQLAAENELKGESKPAASSGIPDFHGMESGDYDNKLRAEGWTTGGWEGNGTHASAIFKKGDRTIRVNEGKPGTITSVEEINKDSAPRVLTGDCRIRIRKEKPALTGDTKIRVRK